MLLPEKEQYHHLWAYGDLVTWYTENKTVHSLYTCHTFFVELLYCPRKNRLEQIKAFNNTKLLEPYLKDIDLPPFFKKTAK